MKKRIFTLLLALALCAGLMTVPAGAYGMGKAGESNIISAGDGYTGIIDQNGALWMWGSNVGTGNSSAPVKMLEDVAAVSCGVNHTATLKTDGTLWMWGANGCGQLGNGTTKDYHVPVKVLDNVVAVSCGRDYTAAVKTDGTLWTWGSNDSRQLGNGGGGNATATNPIFGYTSTIQTVPVKVLEDVAAVSCGDDYTAAVKTDGTLWMWGRNGYGELGNGTTKASHVPVKVLDNVAAVSCGGCHTAAIKTDGTLWTWGSNDSGELGNGGDYNAFDDISWIFQTVPVKVLDNVAAVSCGYYHTAAIRTDGALWMWGSNGHGQLGDGSGYVGRLNHFMEPIQIVPVKVLDNVVEVSCGEDHTAAIKTDGTVWTWGRNEFDQLGYEGGNAIPFLSEESGDTTPIQTVPRQVTGLTGPKTVRIYLNGGVGTGTLWTSADGTIQVPVNPTREGHTFGGWYTDEALTIPWNFNSQVTGVLVLYARWIPITTVSEMTGQNLTTITLNGNPVSVQTSVLLDAHGNSTNYVKLRDIAALLDGTGAQFNVDWRSGAIYVDSKQPYTTRNGAELKPIQGCDGSYTWNTAPVLFDGITAPLEGIVLTDGDGGGHTFFKLRDLGSALGFTVEWSTEQGIVIKTN